MIKNLLNKEFLKILLYLFGAFILVYFVPASLNRILFLGFLPLIWKTKKDYLWLAFFLILNAYPGGLFTGGERGDPYRLPLYTIKAGISFTFTELYLLLLLIKVKFKEDYKIRKAFIIFFKELKMLGVYFILLLVLSVVLGMSFNSYRNVWKVIISMTLFVNIFYVINSEETLARFFRIVFPFAIIALLSQFYSLVNGYKFAHLFKPGYFGRIMGSVGSGSVARPIEMSLVVFVCFSGSLYFMGQRKKELSQNYLLLINVISFISILITASRTWFLAFSLGYLVYFFVMKKSIAKQIILVVFGIAIVLLLLKFSPVLNKQFSSALSRIKTTEKLVEGDITAGGTLQRFDKRAPRVMEGFWSSTILMGAGFSDHYFEYEDGHVGYHNLLLNTGFLGALLFLIVILKIFQKVNYLFNRTKSPSLFLSTIPLVMILLINTSAQTIKFDVRGFQPAFLLSFVLVFINVVYISTKSELEFQLIK